MSKCLICASSTYQIEDTQIKHQHRYITYNVCEKCGFTFKDHAFHINHTEEKKQYDFHENTLENEGYVNMFKRFIADAIDPFIQQGECLDFGSGPGPVLSILLKQKGFNVTLYDPFYANDQTALNKQYDLITSTEVFEHFFTPKQTINELVNLLKPKGILAIMTSFKTMNDTAFLKWWYRRDATHVCFYTLSAFQEIEQTFQLQRLYTNHKNIIVLKKR